MADTTYNVRVKYDLDYEKAKRDADGLGKTFDRLAATLTGAFAVHRILDFGARLVALQSEAERFTLTFATMLTGFGAPGFTKGAESFKDAMAVSAQLMMQIRLEASKLPGTAEEMMEIMRASMPGAIQSGHAIMGPDSAFEMSKRLMAAGNLLQIPGGSTTVAREFQAMMEGRAQTRNDLFARIRGLMNDGKGIGSKEFNALSESGRWEQIEKALSKLVDPALPAYANTWKAISTTTVNWVQQIARVATGGMFEALKSHLKQMNEWIQANQSSIEEFARTVGTKLADALVTAFGYIRDTFEYVVKNKETLLTVLQAGGALLLGSKLGGGFGKMSPGGALGGAGLGLAINALTGGGAYDAQGQAMAVAGALMQFGGALGVAAAAALAFGATMNLIDESRKKNINNDTEAYRLARVAPGGRIEDDNYAVLKQIIQERELNTGYLGSIDEAKFQAYLAPLDLTMKRKMELGDAFDRAAAKMHDTLTFGPNDPTAEQKAMQKLYDRPRAVPEKPNININLTIKQDISDAEDPDRILIKTKQAIEDALIRPIESGTNRFAWR